MASDAPASDRNSATRELSCSNPGRVSMGSPDRPGRSNRTPYPATKPASSNACCWDGQHDDGQNRSNVRGPEAPSTNSVPSGPSSGLSTNPSRSEGQYVLGRSEAATV